MTLEILAFDTFIDVIARELDIDATGLRDGTLLTAGFDSLMFFELDVLLEELGAVVDEEHFATFATIRDVYSAYALCVTSLNK